MFKTTAYSIAKFFNRIAALALFSMMCLTCADVVLRLFRHPIRGTYEMVSFLGVITVSFALAHTSIHKGHVAVSLVVEHFSKKWQGIVELLVSAASVVLFALISWRSVVYARSFQLSGEVSPTLQLPFYPIIYGIAAAAAVVCLVLMVDILTAWKTIKES
ncbi:TRAP transporter, DctQ-like membrane protein [Candidatus Moduliflexus flocculans]|uniref:TRAP transporter, DctQ-like membrane protein n=1 Tax=Candidatus Moduliflexus flocculans TaxID=1499966 RepID=A0A0S6W3Z2_9BACT|nr:TRAP transporter, DctQ-like membrane protein [Candidatus Moduliflexus flocculans]